MSKRFWLILIGILIVFGVLFKLESKKTPTPATNSQPSNHVEGNGKTGVTLLEYGDYECPYCEEYYPIVKQVQAKYSDQIFFQFRNLPLTQIHKNAIAGARAAEAASLQGKFWQMHDALYDSTNWAVWSPSDNPIPDFNNYAKQLGLNVTKFESDYQGDAVNNTINADLNAFNATGQPESTPTFFLDGTLIQPKPTVADFSNFIDKEIAKKQHS
jgi:protein-disulfide isomerase